jgi:hypothetical protein
LDVVDQGLQGGVGGDPGLLFRRKASFKILDLAFLRVGFRLGGRNIHL